MPLPSFHEAIFPEDISYGSSGGPGFNTTIIELSSGSEQRNQNWSQQRATYDVSHGIKTREQMEHLLEFFAARRGKAYGFRFKDWMDFTLPRTIIGRQAEGVNGRYTCPDGAFKVYEPETAYSFIRPITKLVPGTVQLWIGGAEVGAGAIPYYVNYNTGAVTYDNVGSGQTVEIAAEFHVPVRFDIDDMKVTHDDFEQMSWPSIPLVEIKPRT
jgi:uncharacterized protein (TIGR02217 family)